MRPSGIRLVRLIRRARLQQRAIVPAPAPQTLEMRRPSLIDIIMKQKVQAGQNWPANVRLEPVVRKEAFKSVQADVRVRLKRLLKER